MKQNLIKYSSLLILLFVSGVASYAQNKKVAIQNADKIQQIMYMDPNMPLERHSYLIPNSKLFYVRSGVEDIEYSMSKIGIIPQGRHVFKVKYLDVNRSSNFFHVSAVFEAGKYYTFEYDIVDKGLLKLDSINVKIVEVADLKTLEIAKRDIESVKIYLDWMSNHQGVLDGTYTSKNGKWEITFTGNSFYYHNSFMGALFEYTGTFWYDKETILLNVVTSTATGKKKVEHKPGIGVKIWSYSLENDVLKITPKDVETPTVRGTYYKGK